MNIKTVKNLFVSDEATVRVKYHMLNVLHNVVYYERNYSSSYCIVELTKFKMRNAFLQYPNN